MKQGFGLGYIVDKKVADSYILDDLVDQSNLIEGIHNERLGTHISGEKTIKDYGILDHDDALVFVIKNFEKELNHEHVKNLHHVLMNNLMLGAGEYRKESHSFMKKDGEFIFGNPLYGQVPDLMDSWIKKASKAKEFNDILDLHYEFEVIHPFQDGNGRTGRLLLNWMTLNKLDAYTVIHKAYKDKYFQNINDYRQEFMKKNDNIIFTTYEMLSKEAKERLKKEREEYHKQMRNLFS